MVLARVSKSELQRRLVHASGTGLPLLFVLEFVTWAQFGLVMLFVSGVTALLEFVRLYVGLDWAIYDRLTRPYEETNVAGYALYLFSLTAVVLVFAPHVAVPAALMLTIGDPISGLLGTTREAGESKRLRTLGAMFAVCLLVSLPFLVPAAGVVAGGVAAVAAALGATVADGFKPVLAGYVVDDNLSIPPVASLAAAVVLAATRAAPVFG
ncbi:diacylglycerol/polyprenol kinase family protein [Halobellus clavatus]|jgi:dolichol kinase|uniref:Dolichol kinase n=1 Tax=Halobellus clavatus TaxID=660517 RepID=A0A1H3EI72_9EURY|nr:dolichol kinase [Halobellus clavatus]SDX77629.1 Dolichol kinase [Halobellus clavatus]